MSNTINVTFSGDSSQLDRTMDNVGRGAQDVAHDLDEASDANKRMGRSVDDVAGSLGDHAGKLRASNDLISGFADVTGLALPPQAGMIMGVADMADGMGELLAPALTKGKAAMQGLNAVMRANPFMTVVTVVGLLVAAFIVAYKKSETFRNIVDGAMSGIRNAMQWPLDKGRELLGWFSDLPGRIASALGGLAEIITFPYRTAFNGIASLWNNTVGQLSFKIPGWVPGIGGKGFDVPDIPTFANGGTLPGGLALVGERGPELVMGGAGARVFTTSQTRSMLGGGPVTVVLDVRGGDAELRRLVRSWAQAGGRA